jgi:molybdopterin synthase sulfur carrier subunit
MPVTVKLPTILRKFAGDEARVTVEGATLEEVLKDLESRYPGVTKNVLAEGGG